MSVMPIGFPILAESGNLVAENNPEKNLRGRIKNYQTLKLNLRCQSRYSFIMLAKECGWIVELIMLAGEISGNSCSGSHHCCIYAFLHLLHWRLTRINTMKHHVLLCSIVQIR